MRRAMKMVLGAFAVLLVSSSALAQDGSDWGEPPPDTYSGSSSSSSSGSSSSSTTSSGDDDISHANRADKANAFGLGVEATLAGTVGLNLRYFFSNVFGLALTTRFGVITGSAPMGMMDVGFSGFHVGLALNALLRIIDWNDGAIGVTFGGDFGHSYASVDDPVTIEGKITSVGVSGGLHGEWFATDDVSFHGQCGVRFSYADIGGDGLLGDQSTEVGLNVGGDLLAAFGMTVWFQ
jgi:hypothetical protein